MVNLKKAYFKDKNGNLEEVMIGINEGTSIYIDSYNNSDKDKTGYLYLYFHPDNKIFLNPIYCYSKYRGLGVAKNLSDIADYLLRDYEEYTIIGPHNPGNMSTDVDNDIYISKEEAEKRARAFYKKAGYDLLSQIDVLSNPDKYHYIDLDKDFKNSKDLVDEKIVCKKITKKNDYGFVEKEDVLSSISLNNNKKGIKVLTKK